MKVNVDELIAKINAQIDREYDTPDNNDKEVLKSIASNLLKNVMYPMLEMLEQVGYISPEDAEEIQDLETLLQILKKVRKAVVEEREKLEVTTEEGGRERVSAKKAKDFISPIDKLSQVLFDRRKNSPFFDDTLDAVRITVGKIKKEPVKIIVSLNFDELRQYITLSNDEILNPQIRVYHDVIISLFAGKNTHITPDMAYHFLNGYSRLDKAPEGFRKAFNKAMNIFMRTTIQIDANEEAKAFGIKDFQFKGQLLPLTYTKATINGQDCECWKILDTPPLLALAERKDQINRGAANLLNTGLSLTPDNMTITHYLLEQILTMQNPHSDRNTTILYDSVYKYLGVDAPTEATRRKVQERIRKKIKTILDTWTKSGFILGYGEIIDGRKIIGVAIQHKKQSK